MTFIEKFDSLKAAYGKIDEGKLTDSFAVQVEMTDEDCGGIFYVAYMNGVFAIEPYNYYDHTAAIAVSSAVLENILSCKADPMEEFFAGNLKVDGDVGHALMLVELLKKEPKTEVKEVKAEVKAEVKVAESKKTTKKTAAKTEEKPAPKKRTTRKTAK